MFGNKAAGLPGKRSGGLFARFMKDHKGATAIVVALMSTSVVGITGLAVDVGDWYGTQRALQSAADAAAFAGASEVNNAGTATQVQAAVTTAAKINMTGLATGGTVVSSLSGQEVSVTISKTANLFLAGMFLGTAPTITIGRTAYVSNNCTATGCDNGSGEPSPIATSPTHTVLINGGTSGNAALTNNGTINTTNSGGTTGAVISNSTGTTTSTTSSGTVTAAVFCGPNGSQTATAGSLGACEGADDQTSTTLGGNPPTPSTNCTGYWHNHNNGCYNGGYSNNCDYSNVSYSDGKSHTLSAGEYCGGISVTNGSTVTLNPGTYVIYNGGVTVTGTSTLTNGTTGGDGSGGASIFFTGNSNGSNGGTLANLTPTTGGKVSLTAPTSGSMQGVVVAVDTNNTAMCNGQPMTSTIGGSGSVDLSGTVNFGTHSVTVAGTTPVNANADYTIIEAGTMKVNNGSTLYAKAPSSSSNLPSSYTFHTNTIAFLK